MGGVLFGLQALGREPPVGPDEAGAHAPGGIRGERLRGEACLLREGDEVGRGGGGLGGHRSGLRSIFAAVHTDSGESPTCRGANLPLRSDFMGSPDELRLTHGRSADAAAAGDAADRELVSGAYWAVTPPSITISAR